MSSLKFTKEVVNVAIGNMLYELKQMQEDLKAEDAFDALDPADQKLQRIIREAEDAREYISRCDEY